RAGDGLPGRFLGRHGTGQEQLLYGGASRKTPSVLAEEEVGPASIGGVRSRRRVVPRRAGRNAHDGRAAAVRGGQGPRDRTEGAALGRADDGPRSRRGGSPS